MRYKIDLSYDGTHFHGWQIQPNAPTVQALVNEKLETIFQEKINSMGSGRTDTGVHARQQIVHVDIQKTIPENLVFRLNKMLPDSISIQEFSLIHDDFHARYDAKSRAYKYLIHRNKNPFLEKYSYNFSKNLDIDLMNRACDLMKTHNDFECFSKVHTEVNNFICKIEEAYWIEKGDEVIFYIKANRFLRNMVRSIVGTLLLIGENKIDLTEFESIINSKNRKRAGRSVPAHGLYLTEVNYV